MALKRNSNGALIRNALTGALCTSCCTATETGFYIVVGTLVVPLWHANETWGGYYWSWQFDGYVGGFTYYILGRSATLSFGSFDGYRMSGEHDSDLGGYVCWEASPEFGGDPVQYKYGTVTISGGVATEVSP